MAASRPWLWVALAGLAVRLWLAAGQDLTRADVWSVGRATSEQPGILDVVRTARSDDIHPPLYYALLYAVERTVGLAPVRLKAVHALLGFLGIVLLHRWVREAFGGKAAFCAVLLASLSGYHLLLSVTLRMYILGAVWITLAYACAWRWWFSDAPRPWALALHGLSLAAALHTHYYALFAWAGILLAFAPQSRTRPGRLAPWMATQAVVFLLFLPWLAWGMSYQMGHGRSATVQEPGGSFWQEIFLTPYHFFCFSLRQCAGAAAAAAMAAAVGGLFLAALGRVRGAVVSPAIRAMLVLAAVPVLAAAAYSLLRKPLYGSHYLIVSFPPAVALAAFGLSRLSARAILAFAVLYAGANATALGEIRSLGNAGYRLSAELFQREGREGDAILFNFITHSGEGFLYHARLRGLATHRLAVYALHEEPIYRTAHLTRWHDWKEPDRAALAAVVGVERLLEQHPRLWFFNFSHSEGAFGAFEKVLAGRFRPRIFDLGRTRAFLVERPRGT